MSREASPCLLRFSYVLYVRPTGVFKVFSLLAIQQSENSEPNRHFDTLNYASNSCWLCALGILDSTGSMILLSPAFRTQPGSIHSFIAAMPLLHTLQIHNSALCMSISRWLGLSHKKENAIFARKKICVNIHRTAPSTNANSRAP
ncbi:hypothetical protein MSAN_02465900 [Mycena sanguinolenta]|uniref:Uncharacterized protein n=1 Tax=Mycena sanguinolenta TaxID=230812 RepID=A0A8H7CA64_9AGAR|nr:hypothetical protein MSAN_02465900 [Mycena sanguinolenta]